MQQTDKNPLDSPVQFLKGIGDKRAEILRQIGIHSIRDFLYYFPRRWLDRSNITQIKDLRPNAEATVVAQVESCGIAQGRKSRFIVNLFDGTGFMTCVWFNRLTFWNKIFSAGETIAFSGKVGYYGGLQMVHPDFDKLSDDDSENQADQFLHTGIIIPLYPSSEELSRVGFDSRGFRRIMKTALRIHGHEIEETLWDDILKKRALMPLPEAIKQIHFPADQQSLENARQRIKYDELFYLQLMLAYRKRNMGVRQKGIEFKIVGEKTRNLVEKLPFELTAAQKKVMHEIRADMKRETPMYRLLQGDVGSGKTIIALMTMLIAVENGYQAALMAPTEILAEQHYLTIHRMLDELNVSVALVVGAQKKAVRDKLLHGIRFGDIEIVIGTHALIQEGVEFQRLGLIVIDEQHRFGVIQRQTLREKGLNPDVLVMTATPIPRTLSMTLYGDLDVSIIDELPGGRLPVKTVWRYADKRKEIYKFIHDRVAKGQQAYIVFPLVEESEKIDLKAATENYEQLSTGIFADLKVALLHGRMKNEEKEAAMDAFKKGDIRILVTTTVIEVGVDVPQATIMLIEHAERFGLTQLHQLRGRVGRGSEQSYCILIAEPQLSNEGLKRLQTMAKTNNGFEISEVDLQIRGPGEFFGTKQHGLPELKLADILKDQKLLNQTRADAFELVSTDPQLLAENVAPVRRHFVDFYQQKYGLVHVG
ncbi:ATP-dependent DNA helicase RecG [candidate division KSB1 bacterium]|nr:ATP-dependent DNA helicase RecG [candidate division KSB1 bacterium]